MLMCVASALWAQETADTASADRGRSAPPETLSVRSSETTSVATTDSLRERLRRAEEAIELLRQQLAAEAASKVQAASRVQVELFGRVLVNGFSNNRRVNNADVPQIVLPRSDTGGRTGGVGAAIRQTLLGVAVTVPEVLGGSFTGDITADFFGGQQPSSGGRTFPLIRLRTARGIVTWTNAELLIGQEQPLIANLNPVSVASVGTPDFVAAGNLWLWLPQLRLTGEVGSVIKVGLQGAILAPTSGDPAGAFETGFDPAEVSRRPYLQARVRARWGEGDARGEIGIGVHKGWLAAGNDDLLSSEAVSFDIAIPVQPWLEVRGEAYSGRAVRGLGGGGIGQNLTASGAPLRTRGGWAQLNVRLMLTLEFGAGCGVDDPGNDGDPPVAGRLRNVACEGHVLLRPGGPLVAGFEYRRIETTYATGKEGNDHLNLALGFEF